MFIIKKKQDPFEVAARKHYNKTNELDIADIYENDDSGYYARIPVSDFGLNFNLEPEKEWTLFATLHANEPIPGVQVRFSGPDNYEYEYHSQYTMEKYGIYVSKPGFNFTDILIGTYANMSATVDIKLCNSTICFSRQGCDPVTTTLSSSVVKSSLLDSSSLQSSHSSQTQSSSSLTAWSTPVITSVSKAATSQSLTRSKTWSRNWNSSK
eukprot:NODE_467_length_7071_cov_0.830752.p3 type:complete len:210 gc:universal NODE_467_length_7071_cov_0.830752:6357-6986(+)